MLEVYVTLVRNKIRTIDSVPAKYREEVARILAEDEKVVSIESLRK